jgi:catechol 2,3-dioxygenase-like lactoylglutathione lyase family enzyme
VTLQLRSVVLAANDPRTLGRFWAAALGWEYTEDDAGARATTTHGTLRRLDFVSRPSGPNARQSPGWAHFDLSSATSDDQPATVQRLVALGARHIDIGQGADSRHVVLADPEGNPFCVLEAGNTFVDYGGLLGSLTCDGSPEVGRFWSAALGWPLVWDQDDETAIRSADGGQFITFGGPPRTPDRTGSRLWLDLMPGPGGDQSAEVERLLSLGAGRIQPSAADARCAVMIDPDGNRFRVLPAH